MSCSSVCVESNSEAGTIEIGRRLGERLLPGDCLSLCGDLGAGKTRLVQGLARGLGIDSREVSSPTFVLCHGYEGRHRLLHVDAYRLGSAAEFEELGVIEQLAVGAVVVVEWGEKIAAALPATCWRITLTETSPLSRSIEIVVPEARAAVLRDLAPS